MGDSAFLDSVGLSYGTLFPSQGATAAEKMSEIIQAMAFTSSVDVETRAALADGFNLWGTCSEAGMRARVIEQHKAALYDLIASLAMVEDQSDDEYKGAVYVAAKLADTLSTVGMMDPSQAMTASMSPLAYAAAERVVLAGLPCSVVTPFQPKVTASTSRTDALCSLLRTIPYSGSVELPNGMKVLAAVLGGSYPPKLKTDAKSTLNTMTNVAAASMAHAGGEIIAIAKAGHPDVLMPFLSMPALYTNSPQAVHENLDLFFAQQYMMYSSVYMRVAQSHPEALLGYVDQLVDQLQATPAVGTVTIMTLEGIASHHPDAIHKHMEVILSRSKGMAHAGAVVAKLLGRLAKASAPSAPEEVLEQLVLLFADATAGPSVMAEISNVMKLLPDLTALHRLLPAIAKHKAVSEVAFTAIEDFAAGRSLETLTNRVDELDAKIFEMNGKISQTCANMADVIAYVDANMADMKDFLAEVVKKLPNPKRLEVVGTVRKTLILHFECCRTGYEYPIISHEWSKWLKMGFSLVKAGQAVIELGIGNPLGILTKGVECVQEIYGAYKTSDDDEFNTYITNPFLTSTEQDQLLEKLRAQNFFEVFAYDAQLGGWYLLHPEKDGKPPGGADGSVTKVARKEGYGIGETLQTAAAEMTAAVFGDEVAGIASTVIDTAGTVADSVKGMVSTKGTAETKEDDTSPMHPSPAASGAAAKPSSTKSPVGGRAAAMKESFGPAVVASADAKVADASRTAAYYASVDELQKQVAALEDKVRTISTDVERLRAQQSSCACIIQ